jgi:CRP-like cAMP-binding protein
MTDTTTAERSKAFPHGAVIFIRGDSGDTAYRVVQGAVEIREGGRALETIMPGGIFGEMAIIDNGTRSASAVAVGETVVEVIDRDAFHRLIRDEPGFAVHVMREMARRLRVVNALQRPPESLPLSPMPKRSA